MKLRAYLIASAFAAALALPTAASAAPEMLRFAGKLGNGYSSMGAYGKNVDLTGMSYTVSFSYDPSQFISSSSSINSCGSSANNSCSLTVAPSRSVTETLTIGTTTTTYVYTAGSFQLNAGGADNASFNFSNSAGNNFSAFFQAKGDDFFPNQSNVNNPVFKNFSNLTLASGTFNQSNSQFSAGANPTALTADMGSSVPEPAAWAMLIAGFGMIGTAVRRRRVALRPSFA